MVWFRVDDGFPDHPKVEAMLAGSHAPHAIALWTLAGAWCARQLTDGAISFAKVARLGIARHAQGAAELVRVGLWERSETGYRFHDWAEMQPLREDVTSSRAANADRQRKRRNALVAHPVTRDVTRDNGVSHSVSHSTPARAFPVPSRPVPTDQNQGSDLQSPGGATASPPDPKPKRATVTKAAHGAVEADVAALLERYSTDARHSLRQASEALAGQRKCGAMALTVWRGHLSELARFAPSAVERACDAFAAGHADKSFGYLRAMAKRMDAEDAEAGIAQPAPVAAQPTPEETTAQHEAWRSAEDARVAAYRAAREAPPTPEQEQLLRDLTRALRRPIAGDAP